MEWERSLFLSHCVICICLSNITSVVLFLDILSFCKPSTLSVSSAEECTSESIASGMSTLCQDRCLHSEHLLGTKQDEQEKHIFIPSPTHPGPGELEYYLLRCHCLPARFPSSHNHMWVNPIYTAELHCAFPSAVSWGR